MCRVNRLIRTLTVVAAGALSMSPLAGAAASTPSPSPSLDTVLAAPPSGFAELTTGVLHGEFNAHAWATTNASGSDATATENTLNKDGFVDGYGKTWAQASAGHAMIEAVMAFNGGQGARKALTSLEASDKSDKSYQHADTVSGIDPYYGAHFADSSSNTVGDLFVFVKGNDVFFVILASQKDDVLTMATNQAKAQYDSAPAGTIPTADWPENASTPTSGGSAVLGIGIIGAIIVAVVVVIVVLAMRRRAPAMPAMMGAGSAGMPGVGGTIQMSQDGNYWWDGQTWRDAAHEAPTTAQRSSDGTLWWDGRTWRPVPQAAPPEQPQPPAI
jgi:hypothetical protein